MSYILTADWHLRSTRPRCRLDDDWLATQKNALDQVAVAARKYEADVIVVGDIFHSTNETTNEVIGLVQSFAATLECDHLSLYLLAGNHDLPQHNLDNIHKSAFNLLLNSKNIFHIEDLIINDGKFGMRVSAANFGAPDNEEAEIVFKHILCFPQSEKAPPNAKIVRPTELFADLKKARYIFTGDYHRSFMNYKGKRKVFNPGCLLRQAADLIDYEPSVMLIEANDGELTHKLIPIVDSATLVTDEYIAEEEARDNRIASFIEKIKSKGELTFDFVENVKTRIVENKIDKGVKAMILELLEE